MDTLWLVPPQFDGESEVELAKQVERLLRANIGSSTVVREIDGKSGLPCFCPPTGAHTFGGEERMAVSLHWRWTCGGMVAASYSVQERELVVHGENNYRTSR
jgi:hypothetical protein